MRYKILLIIFLFIISLFQVSVLSVASLFPNLLLIVSLGLLYTGKENMSVYSFFISGVFLDIFGTHSFGLLSIFYMILAIFALFLNRLVGKSIFIALATVIFSTFVLRVLGSGFTFNFLNVLYESIVNAVVYLAVFPFINYFSHKIIRGNILQLSFKGI